MPDQWSRMVRQHRPALSCTETESFLWLNL